MKHKIRLSLRSIALTGCIVLYSAVSAATYNGRVVDQNGQAVAYATIYPELQPEPCQPQ